MVLRRILIPQVLRFALPGIGNVWQLSLKDSALISVTGRRAAAHEPDRREFDPPVFRVLRRGRRALFMTGLSNRVFNRAEAIVGRSFRRNFARN